MSQSLSSYKKNPGKRPLPEARKLLIRFGLKHRMTATPSKLSLGEQQRIAIARAIITKPQILIFDEPTASLDSTTGNKIMSFIKKTLLNEYHAIIVVTHDKRIYEFATRIIQLQDGKIAEGEAN